MVFHPRPPFNVVVPDNQAMLSIEAIRTCDNSEGDLADFITTVRFLVDRYKKSEEDNPLVTDADLKNHSLILQWLFVAKAYLKVQRQREDFARKTANALVTSHDLIAYEHLQIHNMVKNHKLAKSIHDAAWGQFIGWMKSYAVIHGIEVVAVPPQYTSQDCSGCGERVQKTLSTRTHTCPTCAIVLDRDENAAVNILAKALGSLGHRVRRFGAH